MEELEEEIVHLNEQEPDNPLEKLRAENAALKMEITLRNISWGEERKKMVEMLESSTSVLLKSKDEVTSLIQLVESENTKVKKLEKELRIMKMSFKLKEEEVVTLNADLKLQEEKLRIYIHKNEGRPKGIKEEHGEDVNSRLKEPESENAIMEELEEEIVHLNERRLVTPWRN
ncbi:unnamed protein product [Pleuronectes platessa]|uniref:Uncharacterized protein n=1 Tax=Pleuronectes platessa TaxID=8262 RepID=A0A9N7Z1F9_PLEPL|nr:unnamed protein product [Pleuronectes platessa]